MPLSSRRLAGVFDALLGESQEVSVARDQHATLAAHVFELRVVGLSPQASPDRAGHVNPVAAQCACDCRIAVLVEVEAEAFSHV